MKKLLIVFLLIILSPLVNAAQWIEIFEKQYIDFQSIELFPKENIIKFWVKALRKDPNDKFADLDYWYTMSKWNLSCNSKQTRIESIAIYDLKQKIIFSDDTTPNWNAIIPETYADGYYRLFCLIPFNENPLFKRR